VVGGGGSPPVLELELGLEWCDEDTDARVTAAPNTPPTRTRTIPPIIYLQCFRTFPHRWEVSSSRDVKLKEVLGLFILLVHTVYIYYIVYQLNWVLIPPYHTNTIPGEVMITWYGNMVTAGLYYYVVVRVE
jgi:hypothetical protein